MRTFVHNPRGLTLLELMGAIMVSTLLLSGAWRLFQGGISSYQRGLQEVRTTQSARALLTMVTRDIQRAMAARLPYGIRGTPSQAASTEATAVHVDHLEMLVTPTFLGNSQPTRALNQGPRRLRYLATPSPTSPVMALQRAATADSREDSVERFLLVHERIQEFSLRYFDGQQWHDAWQQADMPQALEIVVSVQGRGQQPRAYRFTTRITAD